MSAAPHSCLSQSCPATCPSTARREDGGGRDTPCPPCHQPPVVSCSSDHILSPESQHAWCDLEMHECEKAHRGRKIKSHLAVYLTSAPNKPSPSWAAFSSCRQMQATPPSL